MARADFIRESGATRGRRDISFLPINKKQLSLFVGLIRARREAHAPRRRPPAADASRADGRYFARYLPTTRAAGFLPQRRRNFRLAWLRH